MNREHDVRALTASSKPDAKASVRAATIGMPVLPPIRTARGRIRREAILNAAADEFLAVGYERASLRNIMAVAGGSPRTIYQHFGDKAGLFRAIVDRLSSRSADIRVPQPDSDRPIDEEQKIASPMQLSDLGDEPELPLA